MNELANRRAHLSIGEVLSLLQDEFPDVTISKIRFLESQGLLDPERTPSGYRKFYDDDIERLRWILRQQKDHYLPLKVIKDRLDQAPAGGKPEAEPEPTGGSTNGSTQQSSSARAARAGHTPSRAGVTVTARPQQARTPTSTPTERSRERTSEPDARPAARQQPRAAPAKPQPGRQATTPARGRQQQHESARQQQHESARQQQPTRHPSSPQEARQRPVAPQLVGGEAAVSLTIDELADASGLSVRDVRDLERFGLIEARDAGDGTSYDGDALIVARTAAGFLQHGIEARHLRTYKVAIDREAGLFEQIVSPLLKQRNPEARTRAARTVTELIRLGEVMRGVLLRRELRDHLGGP